LNHEQLKAELHSTSITCIAYENYDFFYMSSERGIRPLFELCEKNQNRAALSVADKVIGKAAALLCAYGNVQTLYTDVVSQSALRILSHHGIGVAYGEVTEYIRNRTGDGKCPMEQLSQGTEDPKEMFLRVRGFLAQTDAKRGVSDSAQ